MEWNLVPKDLREILRSNRFDADLFDRLRGQLRAGEMGQEKNRITSDIRPSADAWTPLPDPGTAEHQALEGAGNQAISEGKVGVIVLNGGMATRFGGVVKCGVKVIDDRSFLDLKLAQIRAVSQGTVTTYLMNSFATYGETRALVADLGLGDDVRHFRQNVMLRVTPDTELFRDEDGRPSLNAPGHGDLTFALRETGVLSSFIDQGGELLMMSNVDNLGATLDPAIIGAHLRSGGEMTVELVEKEPGDKGGAPALVDGRVEIVEGFRFPEDFDQDQIPVFNTNTFVFNARSLDRDFPLTWFAVRKKVSGKEVVQFERLAGELTSFLESRYLLVPRKGNRGRFLPVKDPNELGRRLSAIRALLRMHAIIS